MNLLFLGVSSFTGYHFVNEICKNKSINIYCTLTKSLKNYKSIRKKRINLIAKKENVFLIKNIKFGNRKFINLLIKKKFDIICFHHALTKNYDDDNKFDLKKSLKQNLLNINNVFKKIDKKTLIVVSNTIFQNIKEKKYTAVNNYGKSKTFTYDKIKYQCKLNNIRLKSIFITNPWGIYEEKKLLYNLIKNWIENQEVVIKYPNYIRDNIFVEKLSKSYSKILNSNSKKINYYPSGYCSSNKVFIEAFRREFEIFFKKKAKIRYLTKNKHIQPIIRINGRKIKKKITIRENLSKYFQYYKKLLNKKNS